MVAMIFFEAEGNIHDQLRWILVFSMVSPDDFDLVTRASSEARNFAADRRRLHVHASVVPLQRIQEAHSRSCKIMYSNESTRNCIRDRSKAVQSVYRLRG